MKPAIIFCSIVVLMFVTLTSNVQATDHSCVIPASGPWPPCATGGGGSGSTDCVIPASGPWPPCATGGGNSGSGDCVIPASGPWPSCATGGGDGGSGSTDCVIPASGPWPPCATGGGGGQVGTPTVQLLDVPESVIAGDDFLIRWQVDGVPASAQLTLAIDFDNGIFDDVRRQPVASSGELSQMTETYDENFSIYRYIVWLEYEGKPISRSAEIGRDCTWQWYFLPPTYDFSADSDRRFTWGYCSTEPVVSQASQQQFERGFMIWVEAYGDIWVYDSVHVKLRRLQDVYMHGFDIVSDPNIVPPDGLLQPEFGFGKIWRENPDVRFLLGWATEKPVNYQTVDAGNSNNPRNNRRFLRLANGNVLMHEGARGILQSQPRYADIDGFAHPNNGFRTPEAGACVIPPSGPWPPCATGE